MILQGALFGGHKSSRGQEAGLSAPETTQTFSDEDIRALCESGRVCEVIGHIRDPQMDYGRCQICGAEDEESMLEDANDQIDLPVEPIVTTTEWWVNPLGFGVVWIETGLCSSDSAGDIVDCPPIESEGSMYDPNHIIGFRSDGVVVWKKAK